jgi:hypothetical protein
MFAITEISRKNGNGAKKKVSNRTEREPQGWRTLGDMTAH